MHDFIKNLQPELIFGRQKVQRNAFSDAVSTCSSVVRSSHRAWNHRMQCWHLTSRSPASYNVVHFGHLRSE